MGNIGSHLDLTSGWRRPSSEMPRRLDFPETTLVDRWGFRDRNSALYAAAFANDRLMLHPRHGIMLAGSAGALPAADSCLRLHGVLGPRAIPPTGCPRCPRPRPCTAHP